MKIVCISDTHCKLKQMQAENTLPPGDVLVHAGDALSRGSYSEFRTFVNRMAKLDYKYKIYVPGNHDWYLQTNTEEAREKLEQAGIILLVDEEVIIDGVKFYGSPVIPRFHNWAFNKDIFDCGTSYPKEHPKYDPIQPHWDLIPEDTDVLITHGPPLGIMDESIYDNVHCGCPALWDKVIDIVPKYHIFGHIHNWHGTQKYGELTFVNASTCTEQYKPLNKPIVVEIENE